MVNAKYLLVLVAMFAVLQLEMFALLHLDALNLSTWRAQTSLNEQLVNAATNYCML